MHFSLQGWCPYHLQTLVEQVRIANSWFLLLYAQHPTDIIAIFGETTGRTHACVPTHLLKNMLKSGEGHCILRNQRNAQRLRTNTNAVGMVVLIHLPEYTFRHTYVMWLERCGFTPDMCNPVRPPYMLSPPYCPLTMHYIDNPEPPFVMRWSYDFYPCALWAARFGHVQTRTEGLQVHKS
jgi:ubiquinone biosynthesis protein Coq4